LLEIRFSLEAPESATGEVFAALRQPNLDPMAGKKWLFRGDNSSRIISISLLPAATAAAHPAAFEGAYQLMFGPSLQRPVFPRTRQHPQGKPVVNFMIHF